MCNLYEVPQSMADMAAHFGVADPPKLDIRTKQKAWRARHHRARLRRSAHHAAGEVGLPAAAEG